MNEHQSLLPGWAAPAAPDRYPDLTVCEWPIDDGRHWHMDFSRPDGTDRFYASDAGRCPPIAWPWIETFVPSDDDWRAIGFGCIVKFDTGPSRTLDDYAWAEQIVVEAAAKIATHH